MTLIEVLKSGKRIRLPEWIYWYHTDELRAFKREDVSRDDWEVEPEPKPKLKAWIVGSEVRFYKDGHSFYGTGIIPVMPTRAPWLDEK